MTSEDVTSKESLDITSTGFALATSRVPTNTAQPVSNLSFERPSVEGIADDPSLPQNWSSMRKWLIVIVLSMMSLMAYGRSVLIFNMLMQIDTKIKE